MNYTSKYGLKKPEASDAYNIADFNDNMDSIEAELKKIESGVETRAHFAFGTYTGTGTYGAASPVVLSFDFMPKVLFISVGAIDSYMFYRGMTQVGHFSGQSIEITWGKDSISWYDSSSAANQINKAGEIYRYFALG